ncbi:MAG: CDP-2,3-bis-(O-geranylgeranyl)-sn-glycerol synthase [Archaeoglobaceae archaeon]
MLEMIGKIIWLLLPAYTPNNFAVLLGGLKPMDFGKNFLDGRRIFGDGKTFSGFFGGILGGILIANVQRMIERFANINFYSSLSYSDFFFLVLAFAVGSMCGDAFGSFIKRRLNLERGKKFPIVDQLTFLCFAFAFASFSPSFWKLFATSEILVAFLITPFLHLGVNIIAYKLGLKDVPW